MQGERSTRLRAARTSAHRVLECSSERPLSWLVWSRFEYATTMSESGRGSWGATTTPYIWPFAPPQLGEPRPPLVLKPGDVPFLGCLPSATLQVGLLVRDAVSQMLCAVPHALRHLGCELVQRASAARASA